MAYLRNLISTGSIKPNMYCVMHFNTYPLNTTYAIIDLIQRNSEKKEEER